MTIVLIYWKIKTDKVDEFLKFWKQEATVQDRSGLIGEFLSDVASIRDAKWITWNLGPTIEEDMSVHDCQEFKIFVNVGLWSDSKHFESQVTKYFNDTEPMKPFEEKRRVRTLLLPKCYRMGDATLPCQSSKGVL